MAIAAVLIIGLIAIVVIVARALGISMPPWAVQMFWVVVIVVVAVFAIKFIAEIAW